MITTSVKLPSKLHKELLQKVVGDGYGMRGKSKWVREAIETFITREDFEVLVEIATEIEKLNDTVAVRLPPETYTRLEEAAITVRKSFPVLEGVKSNIIRASIMQRLLIS